MAQSVVDACNSALQKLGAAPIMSLEDNSKSARQCVIAFDSNRRSELRRHKWNFAIKRAVLAPDVETPATEYRYQFTLPTDCLRVLLPGDILSDWRLEGRKLLSNESDVLQLRYVADITDATQWDAAFYDIFALALAIDMCEALTNSQGKKAVLEQEYRARLADARKSNAFEQKPVDPPPCELLLARM